MLCRVKYANAACFYSVRTVFWCVVPKRRSNVILTWASSLPSSFFVINVVFYNIMFNTFIKAHGKCRNILNLLFLKYERKKKTKSRAHKLNWSELKEPKWTTTNRFRSMLFMFCLRLLSCALGLSLVPFQFDECQSFICFTVRYVFNRSECCFKMKMKNKKNVKTKPNVKEECIKQKKQTPD